MSWRTPNEWEQAQIVYHCEQCGALSGQWCVTRGGRPAQYPHAPRYRIAVLVRRREMQKRRRVPPPF